MEGPTSSSGLAAAPQADGEQAGALAQRGRRARYTARVADNQIILRGKRFDVERRSVARRDGGSELREVVVHPGAVVILGLLDDGRVLLIRNHRFSVDKTLWELPAGTLERGE